MNPASRKHLEEITSGILSKIRKTKNSINKRELTNQDIALIMAQYSLTHLSTLSDEKREMLDDLLTKLDQQRFDIVSMYFWGGKSMEQIAQVYSKSKMWVSRKLKESYEIMRENK